MKVKELIEQINYDEDSEKEIIIGVRTTSDRVIPLSISSVNIDDSPVILFCKMDRIS